MSAISIKYFDNSKLFLNVNTKKFYLLSDHNSNAELNLKSKIATIELSKNAKLKGLLAVTDSHIEMYQKAIVDFEGEVTNANIRLDNNVNFIANNLLISNAQLLAESYSSCSINVKKGISIDANTNANIKRFGDQKIEIKRFADTDILSKKPSKYI